MRLVVLLVALPAYLVGALRALRQARSRAAAGAAEPARSGRSGWRRKGLLGGAAVGLLATGGFLVAASGVVPIKASSGHWAITSWLLHFSMRRSVVTHTLGGSTPPLDDPDLVLRGAGHYEAGCRPCHGGPGLPRPRVPRAMTPHPPSLTRAAHEWDADELFYIVKHGVKFTGMPAWPAQQRDDEVWAVVAFLLALPGLDAAGYGRLVHGAGPAGGEGAPLQGLLAPDGVPRAVVQTCARCHGLHGEGRGEGAFPRIGGQRAEYLLGALRAYAKGERHSGIMEPLAVALSEEEMGAVARYYAAASAPPPAELPVAAAPAELASVARGREIAARGIPAQRVPACAGCHGPGETDRNPNYPVLAGQHPDYLLLQLQLFQRGQRGGSPYARLMHPIAGRLTEEQRRDLASYYGSLGGGLDGP